MKRASALIFAVLFCVLFSICANAELIGNEIILDMGPMFGITEEDAPTFKGDVNGDGYVTSVDVTVLANALASSTEDLTDTANVYDDDDVINIKDLIALMQQIYATENPLSSKGILYNLAIPVDDENGDFLKTEYNGDEGLFVHVLTDSALLWIQLDEDAQADIYPSVEDTEEFGEAYLGKLCSAVKLENGKYKLSSLSHNELEDGTYAGLNKDEDKLENALDNEILYTEYGIKKITFFNGIASCFRDYTPTSLCNFNFALTEDTIIIVKNIRNKGTSNEAVEYIHYSKNVFSQEYPALYNATIILQNNPESTVENALVIYAEKEDYSPYFQPERIISNSDVNVDNGNIYYNYYTVFNPYTGKSEQICGSLVGVSATSVSNGAFPTGTRAQSLGNLIYENEGYTEEDIIDVDTDFVWLIDYDIEAQTITVLPENSADTSEAVTYTFTDTTGFSLLKYEIKSQIFEWGAMSSLDAETLFGNANKTYYKCYNNKILVGDTYQTKYAKHIKMYVSPIENTNVLDYAIVIVHGDEAEENLNI